MRKLLCFLFVLLALGSCRKDEPEPEPGFKNLAGRWLVTAREEMSNGEKVWVPSTASAPVYLIFRFDGLIINERGETGCCFSYDYIVNGEKISVIPKAELKYPGNCALVDCFSCTLGLDFSGDDLIVTGCFGFKTKYVRD